MFGSSARRLTATSKAVLAARVVQRTYATQSARAPSKAVAAVVVGAGLLSWFSSSKEATAAGTPMHGIAGTKQERTFIAVKPDGVQRGIVGEIIRRFETKGYKLVAIKMITPTADFAGQHYADLKEKPFFGGLVKFFSSGPVVAMIWEGNGVIKGGRVLLGATNPADSLPGSIRGDMSVVVGRNICHGSDSAESAEAEIKLWWKPEEVQDYARPQDANIYDK